MPPTPAENKGSATNSPVSLSSRKKNTAVAVLESHMDEAFKVLKNLSEAQTVPRDNCTVYGELFVLKLRNLDERTREIAMHEVDNIMFRLSQNNGHTPPLYHPPDANRSKLSSHTDIPKRI